MSSVRVTNAPRSNFVGLISIAKILFEPHIFAPRIAYGRRTHASNGGRSAELPILSSQLCYKPDGTP